VSVDEVTLVHWGLLPSVPASGPHVQLSKSSVLRDHRAEGVDGLVTVIGVRYTTARQTAQDAVDLVARRLGGTAPSCRTATTPLHGGDFAEAAALAAPVRQAWSSASAGDVERLVRTYGSRVTELLPLLGEAGGATALSPNCPVTVAEIRHAVRRELALTLTDALVRRTEAGSAGHPGRAAAASASEVMAGELGWDRARTAREVAALDAYYAPVTVAPPALAPGHWPLNHSSLRPVQGLR
jgi:glycerol-3-phosphate dehydrogenase